MVQSDSVERARARRRIVRARRHAEAMLVLEHRGAVTDGDLLLDREAYMTRFRQDLHQRLTGFSSKGTNAARAADLVRLGEVSRWWFARTSRSHAGCDRRGISYWLASWNRKHGVRPPAAAQDGSP